MPEQAFNPLELNKKHKKFDYHSVIKGMISRLEMEGTLAEQKSIGRTEKGKRFNCEREREDYYDLDDNFIDDEEALLCNDSMSQLIQPRQPSSINPEEELSKFYDRFKFLPVDEVKNEMENIQARKRQRIEKEKISDEKITEKMKQLEKAVHEGKEGARNQLLSDIAHKLLISKDPRNEWKNFESQIMLKLERILQVRSSQKVEELLELFKNKQEQKEAMNKSSELLYQYIIQQYKQTPRGEDIFKKTFDTQSKDILKDIRKRVTSYLDSMNKISNFSFEGQNMKRGKLDDSSKKKSKPVKETSLRQVFLKEKITNNTLQKKIKDIVLAFKEENRKEVVDRIQKILGYELDFSLTAPANHKTIEEQEDEFRPIAFKQG